MSSSPPDPADSVPAHDGRDPRTDRPRRARHGGGEPGRSAGPSHTTGSKTSGVFIAIVAGTVVLVLLLVFILQNLERVPLQFLFLDGRVPLGVAILFAAVAGSLIVAIAGGARILQLRRRAGAWKR